MSGNRICPVCQSDSVVIFDQDEEFSMYECTVKDCYYFAGSLDMHEFCMMLRQKADMNAMSEFRRRKRNMTKEPLSVRTSIAKQFRSKEIVSE